eukprot:COSAG01_NODE_29478_length_636_cov_1.726257_1_plen_211_part_11
MRLWYGFYGTTLASEGAFESKMEELCRELGERGSRSATSQRPAAADPVVDEDAMSAPAVAVSDLLAGGEAAQLALTAALEHGVEVLESIPRLPRKDKKAVRRLCEQVESALEALDTGQAMQQVEQCDEAELVELHRALGVVSGMGIGLVGVECVETVQSLLDIWRQCSDPVIGASHAVGSEDENTRMRGLETLRGLPRVVLAESVAAEVKA